MDFEKLIASFQTMANEYETSLPLLRVSDVNSSIGSSWNQEERVLSMDKMADDAIQEGKGNQKMNVKLEPCRGKGLK